MARGELFVPIRARPVNRWRPHLSVTAHPFYDRMDSTTFPEVLRATGHFGLGGQEIKDEAVIPGLTRLAAKAGYEAT